ncbi:MAG: PHP domain-containing protein [Clostridia bacterium]|nr:PHP domain-containing protein [Clostridia bacterium]MDO5302884.1 PHP domain-containing protein [Clostridia bacterium]
MGYKVDYHVHTYYSDGTMKPTEVIRFFSEKEYDMVAITDHDGIDGINEAVIAGEALKMQVIPGIEFGTDCKFGDVITELHILGYHIDIENEELLEKLKELRENRKERNDKLLVLINEKGYELSYDDLLTRPKQTYVGKPNFARALKAKGYDIPNMRQLLDSVEKKKIDTFEAIELIKTAGGIAVLAHPMKIKNLGEKGSEEFWANMDELIKMLKKAGLKGVECFHPSASEEDSLKLVTIAGKYHLHITEGSDFHTEEDYKER